MTTYFVSNAGSNTAPYDTEAKAANLLVTVAAVPWVAGDIVKVSSTHTEITTTALTFNGPVAAPVMILSVLFNGSGTGAQTVGGSIAVDSANIALTFGTGFGYVWGLTLSGPTGNRGAGHISLAAGASAGVGWEFDTCNLVIRSSNTGAALNLGNAVAAGANRNINLDLNNCTYTSSNAAHQIILRNAEININNMILSGTAPTTLFAFLQSAFADVVITASDLTGLAWTNLADVSADTHSTLVLEQCKLVSGFVLTTGAFASLYSVHVLVLDCNSGDVNYYYSKVSSQGTVLAVNNVYADASNGSDSFSLLMSGNAGTTLLDPLSAPAITFHNSTLSAMTTLVEVASNGVTATNATLWQETLAKVTSGVPLGTWNVANKVANVLATPGNQPTSTKTWTGVPGTPVLQKLESGSFTPAEVGPINVVVKMGANAAFYVSPKVLANSSKQWRLLQNCYVNEQPSAAGGVPRSRIFAGM